VRAGYMSEGWSIGSLGLAYFTLLRGVSVSPQDVGASYREYVERCWAVGRMVVCHPFAVVKGDGVVSTGAGVMAVAAERGRRAGCAAK
jgi:hypothetical protein